MDYSTFDTWQEFGGDKYFLSVDTTVLYCSADFLLVFIHRRSVYMPSDWLSTIRGKSADLWPCLNATVQATSLSFPLLKCSQRQKSNPSRNCKQALKELKPDFS